VRPLHAGDRRGVLTTRWGRKENEKRRVSGQSDGEKKITGRGALGARAAIEGKEKGRTSTLGLPDDPPTPQPPRSRVTRRKWGGDKRNKKKMGGGAGLQRSKGEGGIFERLGWRAIGRVSNKGGGKKGCAKRSKRKDQRWGKKEKHEVIQRKSLNW